MAIDFPGSPVDGTTYDYQGVRYIWKELTPPGIGYWRVYTPGTVGIATYSEIDAGTEGIKYVTPKELGLSKYNDDFRQYGLGEAFAPFLYDLTGPVRAGFYYCPVGTPGNPDGTDAYIVNVYNGETVMAVSETNPDKIFNGWRTTDAAGAFTWRAMLHSGNAIVITSRTVISDYDDLSDIIVTRWSDGWMSQSMRHNLDIVNPTFDWPAQFSTAVGMNVQISWDFNYADEAFVRYIADYTRTNLRLTTYTSSGAMLIRAEGFEFGP